MEYRIIFEDIPDAESIIQIAQDCGANIEQSDESNFVGGEAFTLVAKGICTIAAVA